MEALIKELHASNEKMQFLMEQVILGKQNRFGRFSEKIEDRKQICFLEIDGTIVFFNEEEAVCNLNAVEPENLGLKLSKQPKHKGKKEAEFSGLSVKRIDHYLSEAELEEEFGVKGWKQLTDVISRKYHFVHAKVEVEEHYIGIYAGKTDEDMIKADHPKILLHGRLVSSSMVGSCDHQWKAGFKSWMWIYRSGHLYQNQQIVLYEYQQTRNASHSREFLNGYDGICVTDVYLLMKQIQAIYWEEEKRNGLSSDERLKQQ